MRGNPNRIWHAFDMESPIYICISGCLPFPHHPIRIFIFSSYYTRRKFRPIYAKVMNSYVNTHRKSSTFQRHPGANSMSLVTGLLPFTSEMALFEFPFNELLVSKLKKLFATKYSYLLMKKQSRFLSTPLGESAKTPDAYNELFKSFLAFIFVMLY